MKKISRRSFLTAAAACGAAAALSACGGSSASSTAASSTAGSTAASAAAGPVTLQWSVWDKESTPYWQAMADGYMASHKDVTIEMVDLGSSDYMTVLATQLAGSADLDIVTIKDIPGYANLINLDYLKPLNEVLTRDTGDFNGTIEQLTTDDGNFYAVPFRSDFWVLYYNKDLFDQAGVTYPTDDWTQDDVQNAAEKIRALGDDIFGIWQPITYNEFFKVVAQYGGSLLNEDKTQFTINSEENIKAAQTLVDRVLVSNVQPNSVQQGGMGDWDMFMSGRLGMIPTGIWAFQTFTENCDFAWDIAVEPGSTQKATHFFSNCVVMNPETEHPEEVAEWLAWLTSSTESADIRLAAGWDLPALKDLNALSSYLEITPPDNRKAVFESLDYLVMPPVIEDYALMSDIIGQYLSAAADGTMTVTDALNAAQADCEAQITLG